MGAKNFVSYGDAETLFTGVGNKLSAINSELATVETTTTASKAYSAGEYLVVGGVLCKATASIAQGATIVTSGAGKNADPTTAGAELNELNSNLISETVAVNAPANAGKNVLSLSLNHIKSQNDTGTWADNVYTVNGVSYTVDTNSDGAVTGVSVYGSKTDTSADAYLVLAYGFPTSKYSGMLLSGCPNMGGDNYIKQVIQEIGGSWHTLASDDGSTTGVKISASSQSTMRLRITIGNSFNVAQAEAVSIYPMIRDARITDNTFAPYIPSVESRIEDLESDVNVINSNIASAQNDIDALNSGVLIRFSSMDSDGLVPVALPKGTTYTVTEVSYVGGNVIPADTTDGYHVTASNATAGFLIVMLHGTYKTQAEGKIIDVRVNVS